MSFSIRVNKKPVQEEKETEMENETKTNEIEAKQPKVKPTTMGNSMRQNSNMKVSSSRFATSGPDAY